MGGGTLILEVIARRHAQVPISHSIVDHLAPFEQPSFEIGWSIDKIRGLISGAR
jgi:hypothetical protein